MRSKHFLILLMLCLFAVINIAMPQISSANGGGWGGGASEDESVEVGGEDEGASAPAESINFSEFLKILYRFLVVSAAILAVLMIVIGGIEYAASAGTPGIMSDAKERIWYAVGGLILVLLSWVILNTIDPDLLKIKDIGELSLKIFNNNV